MKARFIYLLGAVLTNFAIKSQAQEVTASLADDLKINKSSAVKEENTSMSFNKKVKLTNTENGKSVVVRINDRVKSRRKYNCKYLENYHGRDWSKTW